MHRLFDNTELIILASRKLSRAHKADAKRKLRRLKIKETLLIIAYAKKKNMTTEV